MELPLGSRCVKYLMFIFNLFFVITGIILLSIGVVIHEAYNHYLHFLDDKHLLIPSLLIAIGAIIFVIAFFGCCGAVRESYCMIITFTTLLLVVLALEIGGGISAYVLRANASSIIQDKMKDAMKMCPNSTDVGDWNLIQNDFHCCGTNSPSDWKDIFNTTVIPNSCCDIKMASNETCTVNSPTVHHDGCFQTFASFIKSHNLQLGSVGLGIAVVQLTGIMIMSVGTTIYAVYEDFSHFLDPSYFSPATLLIVVGILIFLIAFMGCCGALRESTCMVLIFAVSLSIVLILELAAAISAYALQDRIKDLLAEKINATMHQYDRFAESRDAINFLQSRLHCCGYKGYEDWNKIWGNNTIPDSCFVNVDESYRCTFSTYNSVCMFYKTGCIENLSIVVYRSALYIGTGAVAIALIQLTGIMFACMLGRAIRRQKTEKERRRWELRENLVNGYQPLGKSDPVTTFPVVFMSSEPLNNA
ncbi:uncharacterized protein LOC143422947 [Xylocopa sonorina]|uniref:uncharacterized protein LOC143422947 n=1 Tax=Xylocopa sonorina TaxID=1818115 RepID=UPI00403AEEA3